MKNCREWLLRAGMTQAKISEVTFLRMKNLRICSAHFPSARRPGEPFVPTIGIPVYERRLAAEILLNMNNVATASTCTTTSGTSTESSQAGPTSYSGSQESDQIYSTQSSNTGQSTSQMKNDYEMNLPDCFITANLGPLVRNTQSTETLDEQIEDEDML
ncbi:uncharacterized protein LOC127848039 [Dreissena polymorpha]|uniref:uncharacterized protein LOC127848039 n=1 Tax=Dreissena polymorpha TaxID=45954 RepID=UPI002263CADF|nr:uncharacterized protein LOC127848039 [Dreissena polymorpha]